MERIWDQFLTERDKAVVQAAGYGKRAGYGARPALIIVDVTYGFTGDRPEPILESIKRWSSSSGAESWNAIAVIKGVADAFRAKRLPVVYSHGQLRSDNWDNGSWSWKNKRAVEAVTRTESSFGFNDIVAEIAPQARDHAFGAVLASGDSLKEAVKRTALCRRCAFVGRIEVCG
jgi:maleamate amidohydrolase